MLSQPETRSEPLRMKSLVAICTLLTLRGTRNGRAAPRPPRPSTPLLYCIWHKQPCLLGAPQALRHSTLADLLHPNLCSHSYPSGLNRLR
jgi:hypothetical protein